MLGYFHPTLHSLIVSLVASLHLSQVEHIASSINDIVSASPDEFKDGYHLVCHSQGALICRCLTEYIGTHQIDTLVSMAGPQMGVYDEAFFSFFPDSIGKLTLEEIYHVAYTSVFQDTLSVVSDI